MESIQYLFLNDQHALHLVQDIGVDKVKEGDSIMFTLTKSEEHYLLVFTFLYILLKLITSLVILKASLRAL